MGGSLDAVRGWSGWAMGDVLYAAAATHDRLRLAPCGRLRFDHNTPRSLHTASIPFFYVSLKLRITLYSNILMSH